MKEDFYLKRFLLNLSQTLPELEEEQNCCKCHCKEIGDRLCHINGNRLVFA